MCPPKKKNRNIAEFEKLMKKRHRGVLLTKDELKKALALLNKLYFCNTRLCRRCSEPAILSENVNLCLEHLKENLEYMLTLESN